MKTSIKLILSVVAIITLSACVPKDVQPIQSLSDIDIGKMSVENVYVRLSPSLLGIMQERLGKARAKLASNQANLDKINARRRVGQGTRQKARDAVATQEKRVARYEGELVNIPKDIKESLVKLVSEMPSIGKSVDLNVEVNSFSLTNGGAVLMVGGSDSMDGTVSIVESGTINKIGVYSVRDLDTNAAGGLLGLIARGTDPRGDMINQFSKKVVDILYTTSDGKKVATD